jgi:hypothetical protein
MFVSGVMLLLGVTGAMDLFNSLIPGSIVRGIQLAVGLALAKKVRSQGTSCACCWAFAAVALGSRHKALLALVCSMHLQWRDRSACSQNRNIA